MLSGSAHLMASLYSATRFLAWNAASSILIISNYVALRRVAYFYSNAYSEAASVLSAFFLALLSSINFSSDLLLACFSVATSLVSSYVSFFNLALSSSCFNLPSAFSLFNNSSRVLIFSLMACYLVSIVFETSSNYLRSSLAL